MFSAEGLLLYQFTERVIDYRVRSYGQLRDPFRHLKNLMYELEKLDFLVFYIYIKWAREFKMKPKVSFNLYLPRFTHL